ncbi:hypothetical protein HPS36_03130 [Halorubrum salinarum]|uniref:DUF7344 domain-containing protein n=1 Tax=Halorubrum salinarum TaxID=2739057 RepID=A0A7D3YE52_9EURY|nr:hypothetical protein [Halorubrum salinarum]QKG91890.1 hypothetical protein HPS36_03130 [Halorubrum salinarum]
MSFGGRVEAGRRAAGGVEGSPGARDSTDRAGSAGVTDAGSGSAADAGGRTEERTGGAGDDGADSSAADGGGEPGRDPDASVDDDRVRANELLELLGNRRRRLLWRHLRAEDAAAALSDASRQIAAWENGVDPADVDYDQRKSVYTSLRQFHCPKMADAGLVEFDDRDGTVRLTSDLPDELVIEIEPDTANVRRTALGALALATGAVLGAWAAGLPVFGPLSFAGVAFAVAFAAVAAGVVYAVAVRSDHGVSLGDALARVDG